VSASSLPNRTNSVSAIGREKGNNCKSTKTILYSRPAIERRAAGIKPSDRRLPKEKKLLSTIQSHRKQKINEEEITEYGLRYGFLHSTKHSQKKSLKNMKLLELESDTKVI